MSRREQIKDMYWIEFLEANDGDLSQWKQFNAAFWHWFYTFKYIKGWKLEDYLK